MKMCKLNKEFGIDSKNAIDYVNQKSIDGALACLESFYYSFNNKDSITMMKVWYSHELMLLDNPLGGIVKGMKLILKIYDQIFTSEAHVRVQFTDIIYYTSGDIVVFAGTETGEFSMDGNTTPLQIRTTRIFGYLDNESWFQLHHHGSIDNAGLLCKYQNAVRMDTADNEFQDQRNILHTFAKEK